MKTTKFLIVCLLAVVALLAFSNRASAQAYSALTLSIPATLAAGTTNLASAPVLGPLKQSNVAFSATLTASATTTNIYTFNRSVDGLNWDTNGVNLIYFVAFTTGSQVTTATNIPVSGYGYLRLTTIQTIGGTATNGTHAYGLKLMSP